MASLFQSQYSYQSLFLKAFCFEVISETTKNKLKKKKNFKAAKPIEISNAKLDIVNSKSLDMATGKPVEMGNDKSVDMATGKPVEI